MKAPDGKPIFVRVSDLNNVLVAEFSGVSGCQNAMGTYTCDITRDDNWKPGSPYVLCGLDGIAELAMQAGYRVLVHTPQALPNG